MRKKEFIKPEIEIISFGTENIVALSGLVNATVSGSANYSTQNVGMVGGTIIGGTAFNDQ